MFGQSGPLMGHHEMHGGFGSGSNVKNQDLSRHQGTCTSVMMLLKASFVWVMSMSQSWMAPKCSVASTASPYCIKVFALLHLKQHETYVVEGSWKSDIEENLVQKLPAHTCKVDWIGGSLGSHPSGFANASFWLGKPSALGPINAGSQRDQGIQLSLNLNSSMYFPMAARWWESLATPGLVWFDFWFWFDVFLR